MNIKTAILISVLLFASNDLFSQGGGPPMITTDPGTPGKNHWEINTTLGYHFLNQLNTQVPATEIVYGIGNQFQISVQLPLPNIEIDKSHFTTFTQPQTGIKYKISNEGDGIISLSVYPQIIIPLQKDQKIQIFIPIEIEKTFGDFRIGEEIGYFVINNQNLVFSGTIVGYRLKNELELMSEFYWSKTPRVSHSTEEIINFGVRKQVSKHLVLMSSMGSGVVTPQHEEKDKLFGLFGVQLLLGK